MMIPTYTPRYRVERKATGEVLAVLRAPNPGNAIWQALTDAGIPPHAEELYRAVETTEPVTPR